MTRLHRACCLFVFPAVVTLCTAQLHAQPTPNDAVPAAEQDSGNKQQKAVSLDLSSPRATMRTFLMAIEAASGDAPERIDDAVQCLDLSELEGEDAAESARKLARRLRRIIDAKGVKLEDIPETSNGLEEFVFYRQADAAPEDEETSRTDAPPAITLILDAAEQWHFSAHTLASIPRLEVEVEKSEEPKSATASKIPASKRSPRATMSTFIKAMKADPPDLAEALHCLNPTGRDPAAWTVSGPTLANELKTVMDKEAKVVLTEISDAPDGDPYVWLTSDTGNIVIARVDIEEGTEGEGTFALRAGEWRFTPQTLKTINSLYDERRDAEIVQELQDEGVTERLTAAEWLRRRAPEPLHTAFWKLEIWQWLALALLLPLGWLVKGITAAASGIVLHAWLKRRKIAVERTAQQQVVRSLGAVATALIWYYAVQRLGLPDGLLKFLLPATQLAVGVTVVWVGYRTVDIIGGHIASNRDVRLTHFDDVLIPLLRKILRLFVVLVVVLFILNWMGKPPTTVLGALGIGGVALAFAAQDTLGNFFGSITVLFDRPFGIGDWIVIGDVEGTVEHVGFRSTRVRTFYNSVVTMPNSKMVNTQVDNYGARRYRRTRVMLSITYNTPPEKIDAFCEGIRELVRLHPQTRKDYYHVYFNQFAASSLDILLYIFFEVPDWSTELRERHRLFVDILRLAERLGVEFAFPTQTVWLERSRTQNASSAAPPDGTTPRDPESIGVNEAARLFEEVYGSTARPTDPVIIHPRPRSL